MSLHFFDRTQKFIFKPIWNLIFALSAAVIGIKIIYDSKYRLLAEGDTGMLIPGTKALLKCLDESKWGNCAAGGPFPPLQYIPVYLTHLLDFSPPATMRLLGVMSTIAFFGTLFIYFSFFYKSNRRNLAWLSSLIFLSSPFLIYSRSTFGEMLTSFLTLA